MIVGNLPPGAVAMTSDFLAILKIAVSGDEVEKVLAQFKDAQEQLDTREAALNKLAATLADRENAVKAGEAKVAELSKLASEAAEKLAYEREEINLGRAQLESDMAEQAERDKTSKEMFAKAEAALVEAAGKTEAASARWKEAEQLTAQAEAKMAEADARVEKLRAAIEGTA